MSNKLKIILAIITSILIISGSAIIFNSQRRNSQTSVSKIDSSSSSSIVSSSSSSQVSSVSAISSSVVSSSSLVSLPSSEVTKIDIPITSQIAVSQTLIVEKPKVVVPNSSAKNVVVSSAVNISNHCSALKTFVVINGKCIEYVLNASFYKSLSPQKEYNIPVADSSKFQLVMQKMAMDYYSKISSKIVSKNPVIGIYYTFEKDKNGYVVSLNISDMDYFIANKRELRTDTNTRFNSFYSIAQQSNGDWSYQFKDFVRTPNGKMVNE